MIKTALISTLTPARLSYFISLIIIPSWTKMTSRSTVTEEPVGRWGGKESRKIMMRDKAEGEGEEDVRQSVIPIQLH
jgi:hypothetical protein